MSPLSAIVLKIFNRNRELDDLNNSKVVLLAFLNYYVYIKLNSEKLMTIH